MIDQDTVLELVNSAYSAAEIPELWNHFLEQLSEALRSTLTGLWYQDLRSQQATITASVRTDPESVRIYNEYYASRNIYFLAAPDLIASGALLNDSMLDRTVVRKSEYYNDFLAANNVEHSAAVVLAMEDTVACVLSMSRSSRFGEYSNEEMALLRVLQPHLQRALQIHRRLFAADLRSGFSASALDVLHAGVVLLDCLGRIVLVNKSAAEMMRKADGLKIDGQFLQFADANAQRRFRDLVKDALQAHSVVGGAGGGVLAAQMPSCDDFYQVLIAPLRPEFANCGQTGVIVMMTDPRVTAGPTRGALRTLYALTRGEETIALELASGKTVNEIAAEHSISKETVRKHLAQIFLKTGVNRQSQLIRMLSSPIIRGTH